MFTTLAINSLVFTLGYLGIIILMGIESSFIPLPSEVILIPAGYLVYTGHMNFFLVLISSIIGSFIGSAVSYGIGKHLGRAYLLKHSKMFFIKKERLLKVDDYFENHGTITVFISRLVFGVRHVISLVAGFANMNFWKFIGWTVLGASIWNLFLICLGYYVGGQVSGSVVNYVNLIGAAVVTIAVTVIGIIYMKRSVKI
jgi:membrane protein DedA with SNARE-associated domain